MNDDTQVVDPLITPQVSDDITASVAPNPAPVAGDQSQPTPDPLAPDVSPDLITGYGQTPLPTDQSATGAPTQSPLDALEQILQQAKANKASATPDVNEEAKLAEQKKKEELAKFEAQKEQQRILDAQNMAAKIAELKTVEQMPEYQARLEQDQAKIDEAAQADSAGDGYEIGQLEHSKL